MTQPLGCKTLLPRLLLPSLADPIPSQEGPDSLFNSQSTCGSSARRNPHLYGNIFLFFFISFFYKGL